METPILAIVLKLGLEEVLERRTWTKNDGKEVKTTLVYLLRGTRKPGTVDYPTHSTALWEILDDLRNGKETKRMASNEAMQLCQAEADVRGIANVLWKQVTAVYRDTSYR